MKNYGSHGQGSYILSVISKKGARVHMVGILGAGMTPLAEMLAHRGVTVTGTDCSDGDRAEALRAQGIPVISSHTSQGLSGVELVVYSLAVPPDAPELSYAREAGIPAVTRAELLGAIMNSYPHSVGVCGTHGKSTTVAMLDLIFSVAGLDPTVVSGATLTDGRALREGNGEVILAEACEYKRAFHHLSPTLALITNIELDHTDCYPNEEAVYDAFLTFARSVGNAFLNLACPLSERLSREEGVRAVTYGSADADYALIHSELDGRGSSFLVRIDGAIYEFHLSVIGRGNMYDALGAIAVSHQMGVPVSTIRDALAGFTGIGRRLESLGELCGKRIYYDYAHHPTEIENTLSSLSMLYGRVGVIFRPHTYSRTASLMEDFASALRAASDVAVLDIYAAREAAVNGVSASALADRIGNGALALSEEQALNYLLGRQCDAVVVMGAGDVSGIIERIRNYKKGD